MDPRMFSRVLMPRPSSIRAASSLVKEGSEWKLNLPLAQGQVQYIDHYLNNYKSYHTPVDLPPRRDQRSFRLEAEIRKRAMTAMQEARKRAHFTSKQLSFFLIAGVHPAVRQGDLRTARARGEHLGLRQLAVRRRRRFDQEQLAGLGQDDDLVARKNHRPAAESRPIPRTLCDFSSTQRKLAPASCRP